MIFRSLQSADDSPWTEATSREDALPIRESGSWIEEKHRLLVYFANIFATGMKPTAKKPKWTQRVYLELFSGPGKCLVRESGKEELGSPLKVIDHEFTRFIFVDINTAAARALEKRLVGHSHSDKVEIWNGNCNEVIDRLEISKDSLTFAFIDPTGIAQIPLGMIQRLQAKTRCDLLINVQHGMGIKMNMHQYTPDADEDCALTQFLGDDTWKAFLKTTATAQAFFQEVLKAYRWRLAATGFIYTDNQVLVNTSRDVPLYLLLFASGHPLGQKFWNEAVQGTDPQFSLGLEAV